MCQFSERCGAIPRRRSGPSDVAVGNPDLRDPWVTASYVLSGPLVLTTALKHWPQHPEILRCGIALFLLGGAWDLLENIYVYRSYRQRAECPRAPAARAAMFTRLKAAFLSPAVVIDLAALWFSNR
jgi:hypothetical protein